ncbi:ArsR/SmtB family transcription factor [Sphingomonas xinjiangensis]|uniref:DNA-binding transcriptional ArsR family regulator n=1 Tax=Sphingomonas xinjiangensis TaxID=643568 RepID=A0A840YTJ6_9SPHN|nr:metalloregulator ArsR/SmtB family transcription factor [Sphingomonas xinjiangensis]MBB5712988.1 DNA-binding transcriptional ArsR family regulator [Sphingomonas xinjiangensis]
MDDPLARLVDVMIVSRVGETFHALADPTRRAMLDRLAQGDLRTGDLLAGFAISDAAAAKHLAVLESAGLVRRQREGKCRRCTLNADPLVEAGLWLRRWNALASPTAARTAALIDRAATLA